MQHTTNLSRYTLSTMASILSMISCQGLGDPMLVEIQECGDTQVSSLTGEQCDDGNQVGGDGCSADCRSTEVCGNGIVDAVADEQCDSAGESASCNLDCTIAWCGDSKVDGAADEECDDGGPSTTCNADCTITSCGDGTVNPAAGEQCEPDTSPAGSCNPDDCTVVF